MIIITLVKKTIGYNEKNNYFKKGLALNEYFSVKSTGDGFYGFRPYPFIFSKHAKNF